MKGLTVTAIVLGVLALLHIPAYQKASEEQTKTLQVDETQPVTALSMERADSHTTNWIGTFEWDVVRSTWMVNCGSVLNEKPKYESITTVSTETIRQRGEFELVAESKEAAIAEAQAKAVTWEYYPVAEAGQRLIDVDGYCRDDLSSQRYDAIFLSPVLWLFVLFLVLAVGGGGGGGTIVGRLTPNLWGGGWTFRGR